jgi:hypothetical protein
MQRNQVTAVLSAVLLFGCGSTVGVLGQRYYEHGKNDAANSSEDWRVEYMNEMRTRAHLTDGQLQKLSLILDQTKQEYRDMRERHKPELLEIKQNQMTRVKSILTAEQIPLYEQLISEREQRQKDQDDKDRAAEQKRKADAASAAKD